MTCPIQSFPIEACCSPPSFGHRFATSSAEQHHGGLPSGLRQLRAERLGQAPTDGWVRDNNAKNASSGHTPFELNYKYHLWMSYKEDVNPCSKSKSADELSAELRELMIVCRENLHHAQELQKRAHDKGVKPRSYAPGDKVWLNSKYIKTKQNRKLEAKFFGPFRVLHPVGKQAYKLELPRKWRIHDVFHVSLLEQDITRKGRVDENTTQLAELDAGDDKGGEYEVEAIRDSAVYARESAGYLPGLYYLISWKSYPEEENTWEPASAVQHLRKLISSFILTSRQRPLRPSTLLHRWPGQPSSQQPSQRSNQRNESKVD